jgi:hypothetical protein
MKTYQTFPASFHRLRPSILGDEERAVRAPASKLRIRPSQPMATGSPGTSAKCGMPLRIDLGKLGVRSHFRLMLPCASRREDRVQTDDRHTVPQRCSRDTAERVTVTVLAIGRISQ